LLTFAACFIPSNLALIVSSFYVHLFFLSFFFRRPFCHFFFFNDPATTEIYTLSLHDALPILSTFNCTLCTRTICAPFTMPKQVVDRKSTRLNSSHVSISYAVFCLKKKKARRRAPPRDSFQRTSPRSRCR